MISELKQKIELLDRLGFKYFYSGAVYCQLERRIIASIDAIEQRSAKQIERDISVGSLDCRTAPGEWYFYFLDPPSAGIQRRLVEELAGGTAPDPLVCREIQAAIENKFDEVQYMHTAYVTCAKTKENCVAVAYVMPLCPDPAENWVRLIDGLILDKHYRKPAGPEMDLRKCIKRILYWRKTPEMYGEGAIYVRFAFRLIYEEGE